MSKVVVQRTHVGGVYENEDIDDADDNYDGRAASEADVPHKALVIARERASQQEREKDRERQREIVCA